MNTTPDDLRLRLFANWMLRPRTLGEYVDECIGFLKKLHPLHPLFRDGLYVRGRSKADSPALSPDLSNLEGVLLKRAWNRSAGPSCCDSLGTDGMPTRQSRTDLGFRCVLDNLRPQDKDNVLISLSGGSTNPDQGGGVGIEFPYAGVPEFTNPDFLRELMSVVVDYWKPEQAGITNSVLARAVRIKSSYANDGCWLAYLDEPEVVKALPDDVQHEPFGPGVLFSIQPEPPTGNFEAAIQKAIRVRDSLQPGQWMVNRYWREKVKQQPSVAA